jgi:hypothetical protein
MSDIIDDDFQEIAHSGGRITFDVKVMKIIKYIILLNTRVVHLLYLEYLVYMFCHKVSQ